MSNVVDLHNRRPVAQPAEPVREHVWICAGLTKTWRITSHQRTFGEFHDLANARRFMWLLCLGNDDLDPLLQDENYAPPAEEDGDR